MPSIDSTAALLWLQARQVPMEKVAHAPISRAASREEGALGEGVERGGCLTAEESRLAEAASKLNVPRSYFVKMIEVALEGRAVRIHLPASSPVDLEFLRSSADAAQLAAIGEAVESVALEGGPLVLWDESLLAYPHVFFVGTDGTCSFRVDTRHLRRAAVRRAPLTARPSAGPSGRSAYDVLLERGYIDRVSDEGRVRALLADRAVASYVGFDPTADSLHVGSLVPIMALAHLQRLGQRTIAVVGGATALVGDPSGKTEMRQMLSHAEIEQNAGAIQAQIERYVEPSREPGLLALNNTEWLGRLGYIDFLRVVGVHLSVNRMLTAESFRTRMEKEQGLSFLEFNYMCLQAYDFVHLARHHSCLVQMGGSDQWGNIVAGVDLARKMAGPRGELAGVTFPLLMSLSGTKFGKTESGNVWLDAARTPAHDFFQFWRNTDDVDVERFLGLFTFLPVEKIAALVRDGSARSFNDAKKILAFAATQLAHGDDAAVQSLLAAEALFGAGRGSDLPEKLVALGLLPRERLDALAAGGEKVEGIPVLEIAGEAAAKGYPLVNALVEMGLASSKSEARRLVQQGGVTVGEEKVTVVEAVLPAEKLAGGDLLVRVGKKKHGRIRLKRIAPG